MYIIYDDYFLKHNAGARHPEKAERLSRIMEELSRWRTSSDLNIIRPEPVQTETLSLIHKTSYINQIKEYSKKEKPVYLDADTVVSQFTYRCALLAAGASVKGIDLICGKNPGQSMFFALVRPPGHHAFSSRGSGFCIFNNIAVAAAHAFKHFGLEKIVIIDFDAHHGNATQDIFYQNKNLFYISFHQYPHYPGTGSWRETGAGQGEGYNLNFPLSAGTGQDCYIFSLYEVVVPLMARFKPDLILVSAGYDSHRLDPLSSLNLEQESYYRIMRVIRDLSYRYCGGKLGIFLEGGYNTDVLGGCVKQTINGCQEESGERETASHDAGERHKKIVSKIKNKFGINDD